MRLKELTLHGFKSFYDGTALTFRENGITLVVGPNGCGKSNIVDAIRWVLGEQSPRLLRGGAMGDVIFNGSASRQPLGRSEVTILFDNSDGAALEKYREFSEIAVTRRLYRSGESEYRINKLPCRLMDVRELLMDTGAAGRSYSIVEQGRVEEFVTASPADRRLFLEEAAGVVRYKTRRIAAEKRLEQTRQNLLRVEDLQTELTRQESLLQDQVGKARDYLALRERVTEMRRQLAHHRYHRSARQCAELEQRLTALAEENTLATQAHARERAGLETQELEQTRLEAQLREQREAQHTLEQEIQRGEGALALERQNRDNATQWQARLTQSLAEGDARRALLTEQEAGHREELANLRAEEIALAEAIAAAEAAFAETEARRQEVEAEHTTLQEQLLACHTTLTGVANQRQFLAERLEEGERRRAGVAEQADAMAAEQGLLQERQAAVAQRIAALEEALSTGETKGERLGATLEERQGERELCREESGAAEQAALTLRSRRAALHEIAAGYEGFGEPVRAFLRWLDGQPGGREAYGVLAPVADLVRVAPDTLAWAGVSLAPHLEVIVVRNAAVLPKLQQAITGAGLGGVRLLALDALPSPAATAPETTTLAGQVEGPTDLAALRAALFGGVEVVPGGAVPLPLPDADAAGREWLAEDGGFHITARRIVTLGRDDSPAEGVLRRRAELAELETALAEAETRREETAARLAALDTTLAALRAEQHAWDVRQRENTVALQGERQEAAQALRESQRLQRVLESLRQEQEREAAALVDFAGQQRGLESEAVTAAAQRADLESRRAETTRRAEAARGEATAQGQRLTEQRVAHGRVATRLDHLETRLAALAEDRARLAGERENADQERAVQTRKLAAAGEAIVAGQAALGEQHARLETLRAEVLAQVEVHDQGIGQRGAALGRVHAALTRVETLATQRHETELALTAERMRLEQWAAQVGQEPPPEAPEEVDEAALERELNASGYRLERMEGVNLAAAEEYEGLRTRLDFLAQERGDLESAIGDLEESIRRMNAESRRRFEETFNEVNAKFQDMFTRVFGGGEARLVLTDAEDLLLAGVDIVAQPPGKKLQGLTLLSGGEKALTAIALIFAFFLFKPSPFCLLDEVDAPLDDVNVGRFNRLVQTMTDRAQFIIITHNKRTMEIGDVLYGVTMEEPGVSRVVSVELAEQT